MQSENGRNIYFGFTLAFLAAFTASQIPSTHQIIFFRIALGTTYRTCTVELLTQEY